MDKLTWEAFKSVKLVKDTGYDKVTRFWQVFRREYEGTHAEEIIFEIFHDEYNFEASMIGTHSQPINFTMYCELVEKDDSGLEWVYDEREALAIKLRIK